MVEKKGSNDTPKQLPKPEEFKNEEGGSVRMTTMY